MRVNREQFLAAAIALSAAAGSCKLKSDDNKTTTQATPESPAGPQGQAPGQPGADPAAGSESPGHVERPYGGDVKGSKSGVSTSTKNLAGTTSPTKEAGMPAPAKEAGMPAPAKEAGMPAPAKEAPLPAPTAEALPKPKLTAPTPKKPAPK